MAKHLSPEIQLFFQLIIFCSILCMIMIQMREEESPLEHSF